MGMTSFITALLALVAGYFIYGRVVDRVFGVEPDRKTPALTKTDGVDFVPLPWYKIFLIQFLNIAGLGPMGYSLALRAAASRLQIANPKG